MLPMEILALFFLKDTKFVFAEVLIFFFCVENKTNGDYWSEIKINNKIVVKKNN
jgi:hypothetical protein